MNADALAGIAKPARASVSISIDTLMNVELLAGFVPKGPQELRVCLVHLITLEQAQVGAPQQMVLPQ